MHLAGLSHNYGRMKTKEWKWEDMSKRMVNAGRPKDADDCLKKWDNLFQNYKKIQRFQNASGRPDFFRLTNEERKEHNFKFRMDRALYNEIHAGMVGNHTIFPPNVADTDSPDGVQLPRRGAGGGESVCSEAVGEGCPDERSSARESDSNVGSGVGGGKRKNARQQAFESISDVMERHGALMSSTIESSSKRQCSTFTRQCDILEQEVAVQKARYAASDETQRIMLFFAVVMGMSARLDARGKKRDVALDETEAQGKGRRHVPKARRPRLDDASASVPHRGARGWSQPAEEDNNDDFMTDDDQGEATAPAGRESARQRTPDQSASKRMSTPPPEAQQLRVRETWKEKGVVVDLGGEDDEPLERRRLRSATQATTAAVSTARAADDERLITGALPCTPSQPRQRNDGGDAGVEAAGGAGVAVAGVVPSVPAAREEVAVPATTTGEGRRLYNIVHETKEHFVAIASGLPPPQLSRSVVVPKSSTKVARIADQSQLQQAISRAAAVENIALCIFHGWICKFGNRPRGYTLAFQYSLESVATDIARAVWYDEEWRNVVNAPICAHTIYFNMDLPLWYAGANIEDRPEDGDMAAYQESTVISIAHLFRAAVQMGAYIDGNFISYERLCRVDDCFRLLLVASMWIIRMAGDDPCSHYEAFYFADLVARPTLIASMHRSFDHRRSVVRAGNVVTERLGKAKVTLGVYPDYIPDWAPCGIGFAHDATIKGPEDAKRLDWLGSGPAHDDIKGEGKDDA
ncbi:hypothetical protein CBR_g4101 [Chara braunii]|uniref:Myb/SANT-like DNA-binding domain-containing protein n=1 Tax=Chara braunii TaxID=69332 RepID=A0A388KHC7_CHABU|nr:hypothetical protein CBR_g4101 [Chara braunii]|eukprot:GBG69407.1 hypothetical protein CBR_g4101 [Chara braunii]